jgi:hypothetical protein
MKTKILTFIFILVSLDLCYGQDKERLSHFIYLLPVMEGMEVQGRTEQEKYNINDDIEIAITTKVFHSKKGQSISAKDISKFYKNHFTSLDFKPWQDALCLSGTYNAPSIVTKGNAYIWSQGHIIYTSII